MLRRILRQGAAILCVSLAATALSAETIAEALADAYDNSGLLAQNRAVLRAADEGVAQATSALLPVVTARHQCGCHHRQPVAVRQPDAV
jgi:outer membrane protein